jgi:Ca2+-binding EF-hand superfamily protein
MTNGIDQSVTEISQETTSAVKKKKKKKKKKEKDREKGERSHKHRDQSDKHSEKKMKKKKAKKKEREMEMATSQTDEEEPQLLAEENPPEKKNLTEINHEVDSNTFSVKIADLTIHKLKWDQYTMTLLIPRSNNITTPIKETTPTESLSQSTCEQEVPSEDSFGETRLLRSGRKRLREQITYEGGEEGDGEDDSKIKKRKKGKGQGSITPSLEEEDTKTNEREDESEEVMAKTLDVLPSFSVFELRNKLFSGYPPRTVHAFTYKLKLKTRRPPLHWIHVLKRVGGLPESCHTCRLLDVEAVKQLCDFHKISIPPSLDLLLNNQLEGNREVIDLSEYPSITLISQPEILHYNIPQCSFNDSIPRKKSSRQKIVRHKFLSHEETSVKEETQLVDSTTASQEDGDDMSQTLEEEEEGDGDGEGEEEEEKPKSHVSFHDRSVMAYEDRIRAYSTPDKIFRYFATLRIKEGNDKGIYMTPNDFIRSITPGTMQPQEYGLDLFRTVSMETVNKEGLGLVDDPNSVFNRLGHSGLISFSDYLFLLTILATPMKHFEMAFKMFDLNGDGEVEYDEFETVQAVLLNATAVGTRHRDHVINGNVASSVDGALAEHFFGPNKDRKLTIDKFQEFHQRLNTEIMAMEFNRYNPVGGAISERDFAHMIVSHASLSKQKKKQMVQRAKKEYGSQPNPGISFNDVLMFDMLMGCLSDVDTALGMYYSAGTSITPAELKQACRAAIGSDISEHLIDVLFTLFDTNDDGELSRKEFVYVLMSRNSHGLQKSRELGFAKLVNAVMTCSGKTIKSQFEHLA